MNEPKSIIDELNQQLNELIHQVKLIRITIRIWQTIAILFFILYILK